jgi:glycine cleavage system H protein
MDYPKDSRYTKSHEWARRDGSVVVVGLTQHAQDALGDIVFVELPQPGTKVTQGQAFGVVESTKAVSDVFAPIAGTIVEVNGPLADAPETVNSDPHGKAWMIKIEPTGSEYDSLMDSVQYEKFLAEEAH